MTKTKTKKTPSGKSKEDLQKKDNEIMMTDNVSKKQQSILHDRAKELAEEQQEELTSENRIEIVEFILAYEKYGIESSYVNEVYPMKEFTIIPGTPSFVIGIINLRGQILSVIDIRKFFELPVKGISNLNRVIVINDKEMEVGILADFILGVRNVKVDKIHSSLPTLTGVRAEYLKGVTNERLVILDMNKILSDEMIIVHQEVD